MDLCPVTFKSFVVQWPAKIVICQPQLKPLRTPIQFRTEGQPQHLKRWFFLKNRPIPLHINRTIVIRLFKWNQLSFPSIEINKPLLIPVHSISQVRFKFRSQLKPSSLWGWWCGKMPWEKKSWFLSKCFPEHGSGIPTALGMEFLVSLVNYKAVD